MFTSDTIQFARKLCRYGGGWQFELGGTESAAGTELPVLEPLICMPGILEEADQDLDGPS